ncbi:metallophosphoesterase family protein [Roseivirga pacifica]|uniref:metallophosphoesterase family protein n=1 Tax=Roseivirga pacifica TaxID=1267423 RepID=UPI003BA8A50D
MIKIGLISDTHSFLDKKVLEYFDSCDEIWHAGDIGNHEVLDELEAFKPTRSVFGNIDDKTIQSRTIEDLVFEVEGVKVFITHIGGKPPRYAKGITTKLKQHKPNLFICGHSHILRVMPDKERNLIYMNPGAAGHHGFHHVRTLLRFDINNGKIENLEAIELGKRGRA